MDISSFIAGVEIMDKQKLIDFTRSTLTKMMAIANKMPEGGLREENNHRIRVYQTALTSLTTQPLPSSKAAHICEMCSDEDSVHSRDELFVTPDGRWLCEICADYECAEGRLPKDWREFPHPPELYAGPPAASRVPVIGWRKVSDGMPPDEHTVIVKNADGVQWVADVSDGTFYPDEFPVDRICRSVEITHWMPFPDTELQPTASRVPTSEYGDAYQGAREDLAIWKRRALETEAASRAPGGWKIVPITATRSMIQAGATAARQYMEETGGNSPYVIYQAMLAAAPSTNAEGK
jgi:hypothetical protein